MGSENNKTESKILNQLQSKAPLGVRDEMYNLNLNDTHRFLKRLLSITYSGIVTNGISLKIVFSFQKFPILVYRKFRTNGIRLS